jgi:glutaredoxin
MLLCCFALIVQIALPSVSSAKLYTWTDRNGIVRRTYYPPPADQVQQRAAPAQTPAVRQQEVRSNQVELYVTSWCPYCKKAINYFQSRGIAFTAYDIEKDRDAAKRKQNLDGQGGVPFAVINGIAVHGYAPEQYGQALQ